MFSVYVSIKENKTGFSMICGFVRASTYISGQDIDFLLQDSHAFAWADHTVCGVSRLSSLLEMLSLLIRYFKENKVYLLLCSFRVHQSVL